MAQSVEHILGKDEVVSSILTSSSAKTVSFVDWGNGLFLLLLRPPLPARSAIDIGCGL